MPIDDCREYLNNIADEIITSVMSIDLYRGFFAGLFIIIPKRKARNRTAWIMDFLLQQVTVQMPIYNIPLAAG